MHTGAAAACVFFLVGLSTYGLSYNLFQSTLGISEREVVTAVVDLGG